MLSNCEVPFVRVVYSFVMGHIVNCSSNKLHLVNCSSNNLHPFPVLLFPVGLSGGLCEDILWNWDFIQL